MVVKVCIQQNSAVSFVPHVVAELLKDALQIELSYSQATNITLGSTCVSGAHAVARTLVRMAPPSPSPSLYGNNDLEKAEVDHWLEYSVARLTQQAATSATLAELDAVLVSRVFLVGYHFSLADIAVYSSLRVVSQSLSLSPYLNLSRWYDYCGTWQAVKTSSRLLPLEEKTKQRDVGQFAEMPMAEMGKVVVRFPPEASGYLHIGHAKACLVNQHYQLAYRGKLIMRFDDTNPEKEKEHFEKIILEDVEMLQVKPDIFSYTSDHFDTLLDLMERLLRDGKAFVDSTPPDLMKANREARIKSPCRDQSVEENLSLWEEMKKGSEVGLKCCVRGRMDYLSDNGALRDPTLYRCKLEPHPRTGTKYKVYPTYDFAISIVDSIEGVTHAMRTTEYQDRDELYSWVLKAMGMRVPYLYEYSRLNLQNTVLSKRKLRWIVDQGIVTGWDDPRFPTVRGILRRGMTVEGLKNFIMAQGSSRAIVMMEWDKIWACNRKVIDPVAPRYTALLKSEVVTMVIAGTKEEMKLHPRHPKNPEVGQKEVWYSQKIFVEGADAETLQEGETVTLLNWGNVLVSKVTRREGKVVLLEGELALENTEFKNTQKLTWLADCGPAQTTPTICYHFDHIITKGVLKPEDNFEDYINYNSKVEYEMMGDPCLHGVQKGDIIQLQRRGFFICDEPFHPRSVHSGLESPCVLFHIPDGHTKPMPTSGSKKKKADGPLLPEQPIKKLKSSADHTLFNDEAVEQVKEKIEVQGEKVRSLKASGASKEVIDAKVASLLSLKAQYKSLTGKDLVASAGRRGGKPDKEKKEKEKREKEREKKDKEKKKEKKRQAETVAAAAKKEAEGEAGRKKQTRLGMECKKEENLSEWYTQVITKAEMVEYYDVSGCYILRPWSFAIWEKIQGLVSSSILHISHLLHTHVVDKILSTKFLEKGP
ncbi:Bifunctional glutamate/proline--tRNA ligase, partial [Geodia barretti]